jgi:hypothetical protein
VDAQDPAILDVYRAHLVHDCRPSVTPAAMRGRWVGHELATGHPWDGKLTAAGWQGKEFCDDETVHPLLFGNRHGGASARCTENVLINSAGVPARSAHARDGTPMSCASLPLGLSGLMTMKPSGRVWANSARSRWIGKLALASGFTVTNMPVSTAGVNALKDAVPVTVSVTTWSPDRPNDAAW